MTERDIVKTPTSRCYVVNNWLKFVEAETLLNQCATLPLEKYPECVIYGKTCHMRRSIGFFSDTCDGYAYANQVSIATPLTDFLQAILDRVNAQIGSEFNGILINLYNDGNDVIGAHSDKDDELWDGKVASVTLGASRTFRIRNKTSCEKTDVLTSHGQLLVMEGGFQREFTHEIPVEKKIMGKRISLTFRYHKF